MWSCCDKTVNHDLHSQHSQTKKKNHFNGKQTNVDLSSFPIHALTCDP